MNEDKSRLLMYPERPIETQVRKSPPPFGLKIFKGEREMVLSRLSDFIINKCSAEQFEILFFQANCDFQF
jgi:hypothetical protein